MFARVNLLGRWWHSFIVRSWHGFSSSSNSLNPTHLSTTTFPLVNHQQHTGSVVTSRGLANNRPTTTLHLKDTNRTPRIRLLKTSLLESTAKNCLNWPRLPKQLATPRSYRFIDVNWIVWWPRNRQRRLMEAYRGPSRSVSQRLSLTLEVPWVIYRPSRVSWVSLHRPRRVHHRHYPLSTPLPTILKICASSARNPVLQHRAHSLSVYPTHLPTTPRVVPEVHSRLSSREVAPNRQRWKTVVRHCQRMSSASRQWWCHRCNRCRASLICWYRNNLNSDLYEQCCHLYPRYFIQLNRGKKVSRVNKSNSFIMHPVYEKLRHIAWSTSKTKHRLNSVNT